jgi:hypothetical protein
MKGLTGDFRAGFIVIALFGILVSAVFYLAGSAQKRKRDTANVIADARG